MGLTIGHSHHYIRLCFRLKFRRQFLLGNIHTRNGDVDQSYILQKKGVSSAIFFSVVVVVSLFNGICS